MQWLQAIFQSKPQHKYAINSKMLGDENLIAWSNLGYWDAKTTSYPDACRRLASRLADAVALSATDRLLDLGCGQGASLQLWNAQYHVQHIEAVELQADCVCLIQHNLDCIDRIQCASFLNLDAANFEFKFDVILCIDAAYHYDLNSFLNTVSRLLNVPGRLGFHSLSLTEKFDSLTAVQKLKYQALLKCADVRLADLNTAQQIKQRLGQYGYGEIQIEPLTEPVLFGFSNYIQKRQQARSKARPEARPKKSSGVLNLKKRLDRFKIEMTAKLCQKLYVDGLIDYVQITAKKRDENERTSETTKPH